MKKCKLLSFIMAAIMIAVLIPTMAFAAGTPIVEVTDIIEITSQGQGNQSVYEFPFEGVVVIKQGGNFWVWTADKLNDAVETAMRTALEELINDAANPLYGQGAIAGFVYGDAFEITKTSGETLSLKLDENHMLVAKKSDLAKLFAGSYTVTYPAEYQWVLKDQKSDSCTGFISLSDKLIGNSWFRMQNITLPAVGENIDIDIVKGNPKNGADIVGRINIANVGGNKYEVTFNFINQEFPPNPVEGDTCEIIVADETVHWNYTGSGTEFNKAPGQNLEGSLTGVSFETDANTIEFYTHFSINTYTYVYEQVEDE